MAMPASGTISLSNADVELGFSATAYISLNDTAVRGLFGVASGIIYLSNGYGKSNITSAGYFGGGNTTYSWTTSTSEIDGINFSSEAAINPAATLTIARCGLASVSSSSSGYFLGGLVSNTTVSSEIDGINFSSVTAINPSSILSTSRFQFAGANSTTKGYVGGGYTTGFTTLASISSFVFSNETSNALSAVLTQAREDPQALSSTSNGYFCGGGSYLTEIDGINFASETAINPAAYIYSGQNTRYASSLSGPSKGYFGGGSTYGSTDISGFIFSSETSTAQSAVLSVARRDPAGVASTIKGYFGGGLLSDATTATSEIDGINFSSEAAINPAATLAVARNMLIGVQTK